MNVLKTILHVVSKDELNFICTNATCASFDPIVFPSKSTFVM